MKRFTKRAAALGLAAVLALSPVARASYALGHNLHTSTVDLAGGASLTQWRFWSDTYADLRTERYLTYTPGGDVSPEIAYGDKVLTRSTLTSMAKELESQGKRVVGGTNGDFYVVATGAPLGVVITDGVIRSAPGTRDYGYQAVGFRADGTAVIGQPFLKVTASFNGGERVIIGGGINKVRSAEEGYFLFTEDFGSTTWNTSPGVDVILTPVTEGVGEIVEPAETPDPAEPSDPGTETGTQPATAGTDSPAPEESEPPQDQTQEGEDPAPAEIAPERTLVRSDVPRVNSRVTYVVQAVVETDGATALTPGSVVLSVNKQADPALVEALLALKSGDRVDIDITAADEVWAQVEQAMGGLYRLVENGQVGTGLDTERTARTAIGIKADGSVILYTLDGVRSEYSVGATFAQVAQRLIELGCVEALGLDGGGSTTLGVTYPDSDSGFSVINRPKEGAERANSVAIFLTTTCQPTGVLDHLYVTPTDALLLAGASVQMSAQPMDTTYYPMETWGETNYFVENGDGRVDLNGVFTAGSEKGTTQVTARLGGVEGSATVTVIKTPDSISLHNEETGAAVTTLALSPNERVDLKAEAVWRNLDLLSQDTCYTWTLSGAVGSVDENGVLTAGPASGTGELTVSAGGTSVTIPVSVAGHILTLENFEMGREVFTSTDGAKGHLESDRTLVRYGIGSYRVEYDLAAGEAVLASSLTIPSGETYLGMWVLGDGSGNVLSATVADSQGATGELMLTTLDFTGWRQVIAALPAGTKEIRALRLTAGTGAVSAGTIWVDQITTADEYLQDLTPPEITLEQVEISELLPLLSVTVADNIDKTFSKENITLTYDGQPLDFLWDGETGILLATLPENDGLRHLVSVTATDASGNIGRGTLDIEATADRETVFTDIDEHWAEADVVYLYDRGIVDGIQSGEELLFEPGRAMRRGEFFVMTARWLGVDQSLYENIELPFADAETIPSWAAGAIRAMYALGYVKGSAAADGTLSLNFNSTISRAEVMTVLGRIQAKGYATAPLAYDDADQVPSWALPYVETMTAQGIVSGYGNLLRPMEPITRAEAARLFCRMT